VIDHDKKRIHCRNHRTGRVVSHRTIWDLLVLIQELTEYTGEIRWDITKPDNQPKRSLDVSRVQKEFGFKAKMPFRQGLKRTIEWYEKYHADTERQLTAGDHC
jgi:nucleoside-diphosphate-sugar epimerase